MDDIRTNASGTVKSGALGRRVLPWIFLSIIALAIILLTVWWLFANPSAQPKDSVEYVYNEGRRSIGIVDYPYNWPREQWDAQDSAEILPDDFPDRFHAETAIQFDPDGEFLRLDIQIATQDPEVFIWVDGEALDSFECTKKPTRTIRNGVAYTLYREKQTTQGGEQVFLCAEVNFGGVDWFFSTRGTPEKEVQLKADFEEVLDSFAADPQDWESIKQIQPKGKLKQK